VIDKLVAIAYLLIYGSLPSSPQLKVWKEEVMHHAVIHADAEQFFRSFRYDAHPMAILTSAFAYLGSYYSEANPSLQGLASAPTIMIWNLFGLV
jgi:citrate synthase